jgi:MFS family permease
MLRGKEHETDVVIRRINPDIDKFEFMQEFKKTINIKTVVNNADLFRKPYSKLLFMGFALGMFNQFTGINAVVYYASDLIRLVGFSTSSGIEQPLIIGLTNLVFTVVAMTLIDKVGRKKLLLMGSLGMAVCLFLFALLSLAGFQENYIMLLILIGFIGFFAASQGTVIWVLLSEMFSNNIRIRGASFGAFSFWVFSLVLSFLVPAITSVPGVSKLFLFFAVVTFGSYFFFRKYLVETKGRTLEEMENLMMEKEAPDA